MNKKLTEEDMRLLLDNIIPTLNFKNDSEEDLLNFLKSLMPDKH